MRRPSPTPAFVLILVAALPALAADPPPVFGPKSYERTAGPPDAYQDTFEVPAAGPLVLWVQNGDDDGGRVASASIRVNGLEVVRPADFSNDVEQVVRPIAAAAGSNTLGVTIDGAPGSSLTVVVMRPGHRPVAVAGRLVLPYARAENLAIALKNGAREPREARVLFFAPDGTLAARSAKLAIPPHGSVEKPVLEWIAEGTWAEGSVEILYAGRAHGRLFGSAVGSDGREELQHAGYRAIAPAPVSSTARLR